MDSEKILERTWDASYPQADDQRLWPDDVVPMVGYARRFFQPGAVTLDLPCGDGKNVLALSEIGPVVAADWSERALRICELSRAHLQRTNVITMKADVFNTPFATGTFENIFCCDLLGHLPDALGALKELHRITSPTGTAVVTLFTEQDSVLQDERMERNQDGSYWFQKKWFFRFYSEKEAKELCLRANFSVRDIQEFSWSEPPHPGYREYEHRHSSWSLALRR